MKHPRLVRLMKALAKTLAALILAVVVLIVATLGFFFYSQEFIVSDARLRSLSERFLPRAMELEFKQAELRILRPEGLPFAKEVVFESRGLCFRYEKEAVRSCFDEIRLGATAGWGGRRLEGEKRFLPRLIAIAPVSLIGGRVSVNLPEFPPSEKTAPADENAPSMMDMVRARVLPKWNLEGSRIEIEEFDLITESESYEAQFGLMTMEGGDTVKALLHKFQASSGEPHAVGVVRLRKPEDWGERGNDEGGPPRAWKVYLDGVVDLKGDPELRLKGDADLTAWDQADFRLQTFYKGISTLRETRLEGVYSGSDFNGKLSLKMGAHGSEIKAIDFVNCLIDAQLDKKTGGVSCGPQTVRLRVAERLFKNRPELFTLAPEFDLRLNRLDYGGDRKGGDFTFRFSLAHMGFLRLGVNADGWVAQTPSQGLTYDIAGGIDFTAERFSRIVELFRATSFSVPAPLNVLDGPLNAKLRAHLNQDGGSLRYEFAPDLESRHQRVDLKVSGATDLVDSKEGMKTVTDVSVDIASLRLSAPRFELKAPPQLMPDRRFGSLPPMSEVYKEDVPGKQGLDLRYRIRTTQTNAIQIATNLTQAPIPISMDLTVGGELRPIPPVEEPEALPVQSSGPKRDLQMRGPASIDPRGPAALVTRIPIHQPKPRPVVQDQMVGYVHVGNVPVEIFRRQAMLETLRIDFTADGRQRLDGRVNVHYLEYDIFALLLGEMSDPQIKLVSDPPLDDDQIIAVLVFGRPLGDLSEDQQSSVSDLNAAFTDAVLGLGSLYFLASTPVESVGYDPERGMVTAKVGLGGGATLELGGGGEGAAGVGVRKRIARNWTLRSDVERLGTTGRRTVSAFIEWVKRF